MSGWTVQLQTQDRYQAIDVSVGVASGVLPHVFHEADNFPVAVLSGFSIKSLLADAMIRAWRNSTRVDPYDIPSDNKMSFEKRPSDAAVYPIRRVKKFSGKKVRVHFDSKVIPLTEELLQQDQDALLTKSLKGRCGGVIVKSLGGMASSSGLGSFELNNMNIQNAFFSGSCSKRDLDQIEDGVLDVVGEQEVFWSRKWLVDIRDERLKTQEMKVALQTLGEKYPVKSHWWPVGGMCQKM